MGPVLSASKDDGTKEEKNQLDMMEENMKNKLKEFEAVIKLQRGGNISDREIGGGRTVQRSTTMRVVHKTGVSESIKSSIADFFSAVEGGKNAKKSALDGTQKLISSAIDGLLGTGSGSSNEIAEFVVLFMNYSFVRVDYMAYFYNVEGKGILKAGQQGGFCSIMDVSIIPHEQINSEEVSFLLAQCLHMDPGTDNFEADLQVLMKLEILLAEERLITRKINDENTTLDDIRRIKETLSINKEDKAKLVKDLASYEYVDPMIRIKKYDEGRSKLDGDLNEMKPPYKISDVSDAMVHTVAEAYADGKSWDSSEIIEAKATLLAEIRESTGNDKYDWKPSEGKPKAPEGNAVIAE